MTTEHSCAVSGAEDGSRNSVNEADFDALFQRNSKVNENEESRDQTEDYQAFADSSSHSPGVTNVS